MEGGQPEAESLHAMGVRRNCPQVSACMVPKSPPHFLGYNAHSYSYPNIGHYQHWQQGNQYQYGKPSQS